MRDEPDFDARIGKGRLRRGGHDEVRHAAKRNISKRLASKRVRRFPLQLRRTRRSPRIVEGQRSESIAERLVIVAIIAAVIAKVTVLQPLSRLLYSPCKTKPDQ